jgi:hypothetical protein
MEAGLVNKKWAGIRQLLEFFKWAGTETRPYLY